MRRRKCSFLRNKRQTAAHRSSFLVQILCTSRYRGTIKKQTKKKTKILHCQHNHDPVWWLVPSQTGTNQTQSLLQLLDCLSWRRHTQTNANISTSGSKQNVQLFNASLQKTTLPPSDMEQRACGSFFFFLKLSTFLLLSYKSSASALPHKTQCFHNYKERRGGDTAGPSHTLKQW